MPKKIAIIALGVIALIAVAGAAAYFAVQRQEREAEKVRQEKEQVATLPEPTPQKQEGAEKVREEEGVATIPKAPEEPIARQPKLGCDLSRVRVEIPEENPTVIYLITGSSKQQILSIQDIPSRNPPYPSYYHNFRTASLSPDCKKVAISVYSGTFDWAGVLNLDDYTLKRLHDFYALVNRFIWSPNGRYLAGENGLAGAGIPSISIFDFWKDEGYEFDPFSDTAYYDANWSNDNKLRFCAMPVDRYFEEKKRDIKPPCETYWEFDPLTKLWKLLR